jgi:hypothetical protein
MDLKMRHFTPYISWAYCSSKNNSGPFYFGVHSFLIMSVCKANQLHFETRQIFLKSLEAEDRCFKAALTSFLSSAPDIPLSFPTQIRLD